MNDDACLFKRQCFAKESEFYEILIIGLIAIVAKGALVSFEFSVVLIVIYCCITELR
jgi:hypothetical protein